MATSMLNKSTTAAAMANNNRSKKKSTSNETLTCSVTTGNGELNRNNYNDNNMIKLKLKKPKSWNWELTTSKSMSCINFPRILLYDHSNKLLADANESDCIINGSNDGNNVFNIKPKTEKSFSHVEVSATSTTKTTAAGASCCSSRDDTAYYIPNTVQQIPLPSTITQTVITRIPSDTVDGAITMEQKNKIKNISTSTTTTTKSTTINSNNNNNNNQNALDIKSSRSKSFHHDRNFVNRENSSTSRRLHHNPGNSNHTKRSLSVNCNEINKFLENLPNKLHQEKHKGFRQIVTVTNNRPDNNHLYDTRIRVKSNNTSGTQENIDFQKNNSHECVTIAGAASSLENVDTNEKKRPSTIENLPDDTDDDDDDDDGGATIVDSACKTVDTQSHLNKTKASDGFENSLHSHHAVGGNWMGRYIRSASVSIAGVQERNDSGKSAYAKSTKCKNMEKVETESKRDQQRRQQFGTLGKSKSALDVPKEGSGKTSDKKRFRRTNSVNSLRFSSSILERISEQKCRSSSTESQDMESGPLESQLQSDAVLQPTYTLRTSKVGTLVVCEESFRHRRVRRRPRSIGKLDESTENSVIAFGPEKITNKYEYTGNIDCTNRVCNVDDSKHDTPLVIYDNGFRSKRNKSLSCIDTTTTDNNLITNVTRSHQTKLENERKSNPSHIQKMRTTVGTDVADEMGKIPIDCRWRRWSDNKVSPKRLNDVVEHDSAIFSLIKNENHQLNSCQSSFVQKPATEAQNKIGTNTRTTIPLDGCRINDVEKHLSEKHFSDKRKTSTMLVNVDTACNNNSIIAATNNSNCRCEKNDELIVQNSDNGSVVGKIVENKFKRRVRRCASAGSRCGFILPSSSSTLSSPSSDEDANNNVDRQPFYRHRRRGRRQTKPFVKECYKKAANDFKKNGE